MNKKYKSLFEDLGKPTLRGVRKCPKCGTFNGTRGISCKNKSCKLIFRESKKKKQPIKNLDAAKIITGSDSQIYSVRMRDRGRDYRGFVQLPLIEGLDSFQSTPEIELIVQLASQCHVESCPRSKQQELSETSLNTHACKHISSAILSLNEAVSLDLKNSVLDSFPIESDMKQDIWTLAAEACGPFVQRVSKNVMVVKCKADKKHPLGYLHFYFFNTNPAVGALAVCECEMNEVLKPGSWKRNQSCVHYYACICAFMSDEKLKEEFKCFINSDASLSGGVGNSLLSDFGGSQEEEGGSFIKFSDTASPNQITTSSENEEQGPKKKTKVKTEEMLVTVQDADSVTMKAQCSPKKAFSNSVTKKTGSAAINEESVNVSFVSWLASVTERINQTMHFQFSGNPDPLVFHIPQVFFECLQQRISSSSMKKRLPNATTTFVRKDALPLGVFTKYTWHIANELHVKQIFDTPEMPLLVTRTFIENRDGTYDPYDPSKSAGEELTEQFKKTNNKPLIKPLELKTYLKVGNTPVDSKDPCPFIVEWIPNILPQSSIGELRIAFQYRHLRNGRVEIPPSPRRVLHIHRLCT